MALSTLVGVEAVNGHKVAHSNAEGVFQDANTQSHHIAINYQHNILAFKFQHGTVLEEGVNGCQIVDAIATLKIMLEQFQARVPSVYNETTIAHLQSAIDAQNARTADRQARGVEGTREV